MQQSHISKMQKAHKKIYSFSFEKIPLKQGYSNRYLRIDLNNSSMEILQVTQEMKDLWVGGKGFDMWLTLQEINESTKWDSDNNPICFSVGPLGGSTSFPGSGKTIVTAISPATHSMMDSNVGGYFGPYMKFAGFDAIVIVGKAKVDSLIYMDAVKGEITIETAPYEVLDSHIIAEDLTEMYANDELDKRNIAVVSAGSASEHSRMGLLNFSFYDWRRKIARLKQAGRGGIGTVFRNKNLKALIIKNEGITPQWSIAESKVTKKIIPQTTSVSNCKKEVSRIDNIIKKWNSDPAYLIEIMQHLQQEMRYISKTAVDRLNILLKTPRSHIYHIATFYDIFSLEPKGENIIKVCMGPGCHAKGASTLLQTFEKELNISEGETTKDNKFTLLSSGCLGACDKAPLISINNKLISVTDPIKIKEILTLKDLPIEDIFAPEVLTKKDEHRICMCGGDANYSTFRKLLKNNFPKAIIDEIKESGLKGRGGAGFLTGDKFDAVRNHSLEKNISPIIVINSSIFEPNPDNVIEGMLITALATGAKEGFISYRNEHLPALIRQHTAIQNAFKKGLLGKNILGSDFSFNITVRHGAGGFVTGESSALLQTLNGLVGEPRAKYIKLAEAGHKNVPTLVDNIETIINIPQIMERGANWFKNIGEYSNGTKLLSISGDVKNPCYVEVPFGVSLGEVINDYAEGVKNPRKRSIKAIQVGGPTGGFLPTSMLDLKIDFNSFEEVGAIMGNSMISVKNDRKCIVDSLKYQVDFLLNESCGKCTPCREGLFILSNIIKKITEGNGHEDDLNTIEEIAESLKETSLCGFGKTASNPVISAIKYFKKEFLEHIHEKTCKSGVCKELVTFDINSNCTGCTICKIKCPTNCIIGEKKSPHNIDQINCIKCGTCFDVCNFSAVEVK